MMEWTKNMAILSNDFKPKSFTFTYIYWVKEEDYFVGFQRWFEHIYLIVCWCEQKDTLKNIIAMS